jgi:nucleotide-binding universal stress UspA family protein
MFNKIVVGTDGSATAEEAVRVAAELAALCKTELHIVSAYRKVPLRKLQKQRAAVPEEFAWDIHDRSEVDATLARAAKGVEASGATCILHAADEDPVAAILSVAEQEAAGLVVVGNKGMEHRLLHSIPNSVAHRAHTAVLIVATT